MMVHVFLQMLHLSSYDDTNQILFIISKKYSAELYIQITKIHFDEGNYGTECRKFEKRFSMEIGRGRGLCAGSS